MQTRGWKIGQENARTSHTHTLDKRDHIKLKINLGDKVKRCFANDLRLMNFSQDKQYASAYVFVCGENDWKPEKNYSETDEMPYCRWYSNQSRRKKSAVRIEEILFGFCHSLHLRGATSSDNNIDNDHSKDNNGQTRHTNTHSHSHSHAYIIIY